MSGKRNIARKGVVGGLIAGLACAVLPMSARAQTASNDQIKQLQDAIRKIQREYQSQIHGLQKPRRFEGGTDRAEGAAACTTGAGTGAAAAGRRTPAAGAGWTGSAAACAYTG